MSVKIKLSYNSDEELDSVIKLLSPVMTNYKVSRNQEGRYKKAYIGLDDKRLDAVLANKNQGKTR